MLGLVHVQLVPGTDKRLHDAATMERKHLAELQRSRRTRFKPQDVGLPVRGPHRTRGCGAKRSPGSRTSPSSTTRGWSGARGSNPVSARPARTGPLPAPHARLAEHLAGVAAESPAGAPSEALPSLLNLLDHMRRARPQRLLRHHRLAVALFEDFSALPPNRRNLDYRHLPDPDPASRHYGLVNAEDFAPSPPAGCARPAATPTTHTSKPSTTLHGRSTEFARLRAAASSRWALPVQDHAAPGRHARIRQRARARPPPQLLHRPGRQPFARRAAPPARACLGARS
jgi:hypothetical protein